MNATRAFLVASVALVAGLGALRWRAASEERRVRTTLLPRIERLGRAQRYDRSSVHACEAWPALAEAQAVLGDDPELARGRRAVACKLRLRSEPPGARVRVRPYGVGAGAWLELGRTPLAPCLVPAGLSSVEVSLPGHRTVRDLLWGATYWGNERRWLLDPADAALDLELGTMARIASEAYPLQLPGLDHLPVEPLAPFLIDRHETTNAEFLRFVEAGGYDDEAWWAHPLLAHDGRIGFAEAMRRFRDRSGRPGPAGWLDGRHPEGEGEHPVGGISWFEAAAYARFVGKELPTVFHWTRAAFPYASAEIVPRSSFGDGPVPAGSPGGESRAGTRHMAGNVREWCANATPDGRRFLLGGGWSDLPSAFHTARADDPFDRAPENGVRCVRIDREEPNRTTLARPLADPSRDFRAEVPEDDAAFERFLELFRHESAPLRATLERDEVHRAGRRQVVAFDGVGTRLRAIVLLPHQPAEPAPVVLYFPGSGALHARSSESFTPDSSPTHVALLASGRAVVLPIFTGTFERGPSRRSDFPDASTDYRDHVVTWARELARSIDYLETREDLHAGRIAYFGTSWGGTLGAILPAVEPRIRCSVLTLAGMLHQRALPEVEQVTHVGRVTQPTLMLNGELDFFFPVETAQRPLFDLLGTPDAHKRHVTYPGSHSLPRDEADREILAWLDRYL